MQENTTTEAIDWNAIYEAERFRAPVRELSPDVTRHFAWEGWDPQRKRPGEWLKHHAHCFHFTNEEILAGRTTRQMPIAAGVYFLFDGDRCIYVGLTKCFRSRSEQHLESGKQWTSHAYIEVPMIHATAVEAYYIRRYDPPLNNKYPPDRTFSGLVVELGLGADAPTEREPRIIVIRAPRPLPTLEQPQGQHHPAAVPHP